LVEFGFTDFETITDLNDDQVKTTCSANVPAGNMMMTDPGLQISPIAERNLGLLVFWLKHLVRVSCTPRAQDITVAMLRGWIHHNKAYKATLMAPVDSKPKINVKDWSHTMDNIKNYLTQCPGETKIPLAYVVRKEVEVIDEAMDPVEDFKTLEHEMIYHAPHGTMIYKMDNAKVHAILQSLCEGTKQAVTVIRPAEATSDGRTAWFPLP
jgi:hypothetical protein